MKKTLVVLIVMVCLAAGIWGIFMLRGSAGKAGGHVENDNGNTGVAADVTESGTTTEEQTADSQETTEVTEEEKPSLVDETLAGMTLHEKVCQMMFVTPEELTGEDGVTVAGDATRQALENYPVGGIVYFAKNLESQDQVKEMIDNSQKYSSIGLFVATDEEGGVVNRLMDTVGTTYIGSMYYYKDDGDETAYENAYTIANDMSALGFNLDFAPVADVWSNPDNTVIGERAYSDDYAQAAELVGNAVKGFNDGGVMCTLKHFPGHGDTAEDSHYSSAYVHRTKEEIMADHSKHFILQGLVTDWSLRFVLVRKDINAFRIMLICITDCLSNQLCQLPADRFFISSCFRLVYDNHILTVMFIKAVFPQGQRVGNSGSKHLVDDHCPCYLLFHFYNLGIQSFQLTVRIRFEFCFPFWRKIRF